MIVEEPLKGLIYIVRELILFVLSIVKYPAPVLLHLKLDAQIPASSTDVILRFHQLVKLVDGSLLRFGSRIKEQDMLRIQVLAEASEEVQVRIDLLVVEVFHSSDDVDLFVLVGDQIQVL